MNFRPFAFAVIVTALSAVGLAGCDGDPETTGPVFDFQRLDADGAPHTGGGDYTARPWACVRDARTGLVWEVKTDNGGLHDAAHTYSWYRPGEPDNVSSAGLEDGGECAGSRCDTHHYVVAVNAAGWCGFTDWRLPTREEIATINDRRVPYPGPTIDRDHFPNARNGQYWTGTIYPFHHTGAWAWSFDYGYDRVDHKRNAKHVRLVRDAAGGDAQ